MKRLTLEWIEKPEQDLESGELELRRRSRANLDLACFLGQQAAEKYIKAVLQELGVRPRYIHDLDKLVQELPEPEPRFELLVPDLAILTTYCVIYRYPGKDAGREEAKWALGLAKEVRAIARLLLGLPDE